MAESAIALMGLFIAGFLGTKVARWLRLPHSVLLVILGVAAGLALRHFYPLKLGEIQHLIPEIILYVLLPALVFESAYNFKFEDLRKDLMPIAALAVGGLMLSTAIIGLGLHLIFHLQLLHALVFGALISATDPVAFVDLLKELGGPKRLRALVEGESLINRGAGLVLFRVLAAFAAAPALSPAMVTSGAAQFCAVALGGTFVGLVVAWVVNLFLRMISHSAAAQLGLTVAAAYMTFLVSEHVFHVSGVISTMVLGMYLGHRSRLVLNKEALQGMSFIWEFLALSATTLVFLAVGVTVDPAMVISSFGYVFPTLMVAYFARMASVYGVLPITNKLGFSAPITFEYQMILVWGGLRGGLSLALVLMLPDGFAYKQLFLALATSVVLATLFLNALTIRGLMRTLELDRLSPSDQKYYYKTFSLISRVVFDSFTEAAKSGSLSSALVDQQEQVHSQEIAKRESEVENRVSGNDRGMELRFAINSLLLIERKYYDEKLENGVLSKRAYINLCESVERRMEVFNQGGLPALKEYHLRPNVDGRIDKMIAKVLSHWSGWNMRRLASRLEVLLHLRNALVEVRKAVKNAEAVDIYADWETQTQKMVDTLYALYPNFGSAVQVAFIANTVASRSEKAVLDLERASIISGTVAAKVHEAIDQIHQDRLAESRRLLSPSLDYLLGRIPLFEGLDAKVIEKLANSAKRQVLAAHHPVVKEGEDGDSLYLITAGILEVSSEGMAALGLKPRLFTGDFFGEMSLLFKRPRSATVKTVVPSEVIEIGQDAFNELMNEFPEIKKKVDTIARQRDEENQAAA